MVYYIPCRDPDTAGKILKAIERFSVENGAVIELAGMEKLNGHIAGRYKLKNFDLYEFPVPAHTLLQNLDCDR